MTIITKETINTINLAGIHPEVQKELLKHYENELISYEVLKVIVKYLTGEYTKQRLDKKSHEHKKKGNKDAMKLVALTRYFMNLQKIFKGDPQV
jgi:hypothetical protein